MKYRISLSTAALLLGASLAVPAALAQSQPSPAVMTDVAPLPAQERQSMGAIVIEDQHVLAHRAAFNEAGQRTGVATLGRGVIMETLRAAREAALADAADARARDATRAMGGAPAPKTTTPAP